MKITRELVASIAQSKGYEPVQIDGIPEGFSWKEPDLTVGETIHKGRYVAFSPLKDEAADGGVMRAETIEELLPIYKQYNV